MYLLKDHITFEFLNLVSLVMKNISVHSFPLASDWSLLLSCNSPNINTKQFKIISSNTLYTCTYLRFPFYRVVDP